MTSNQLTKDYKYRIKCIKNEFDVVSSDVTGHDDCGELVEYTLKNGMVIDSWDASELIKERIWRYKLRVAQKGIYLKGLVHFVDPDFCLQENPILVPITKEEAINDILQNKLKKIVEKYIKYQEETYEKTIENINMLSFEKRNLYWELQDLTKNIYMVLYNNPAIFIKTIKFIFKSDNIISDMLSIVGLDEEELELLKSGLDKE